MNKSALFGALVLLLLLALGLYYKDYWMPAEQAEEPVDNRQVSQEVDEQETGNLPETGFVITNPENPPEPPPLPSVDETPFSAQVVKQYRSAKNATEAMEAILAAYDQGFDLMAQDLETQLHKSCAFMENSRAPYENTQWAFDQMAFYCDDFAKMLTEEEYWTRLDNDRLRDTTEVLANAYSFMELEEIREHFLAFMANAKYPEDLKAGQSILDYLYNYERVLELGQDDYFLDRDAVQAQQAALNLYQCQLFDGCGSDSFNTLQTCMVTGRCQPGWSLQDYYLNNLSPVAYEQAMKIVSNLHSYRDE